MHYSPSRCLKASSADYYFGRVDGAERKASVWCLSVCLSRSSGVTGDCLSLRRCNRVGRGQRMFWPFVRVSINLFQSGIDDGRKIGIYAAPISGICDSPTATWVRLATWGFLLVLYSNHSSKLHRFELLAWNRRTD